MTAFIFEENQRVTWPVHVNVPDPNSQTGKVMVQTLKIEIDYDRLIDNPIYEDARHRATAEDVSAFEVTEIMSTAIRDLAEDVVVGFSGMKAGPKKSDPDVEFTPELFKKLLRRPSFFVGVKNALEQVRNGQAAKTGN
tara:strand:+ start:14157 stop:14570 length:414 start_codon:yes stop_codon:yes gene_type:complete